MKKKRSIDIVVQTYYDMSSPYNDNDDESYHSEDISDDEENVSVDFDDEVGRHVADDQQEKEEKYLYDEEEGEEGEQEEVENDVYLEGGADGDEDEDDEETEIGDSILKKMNAEWNKKYLIQFHPESVLHNEEEVSILSKVVRDINNNITDPMHRTLPYLTKYEKARILGQRAKQINEGAKVFVTVPDKVMDGYVIAEMELREKRIPFIIRRPLPNGGCEYWNLRDLEVFV